MKEQEFQLELERFRQKAVWEKDIFYFVLTALWGIILLYFNGEKIFDLEILNWFLILGIFLMIGEFLIHKYLDVEKDKIYRKIK